MKRITRVVGGLCCLVLGQATVAWACSCSEIGGEAEYVEYLDGYEQVFVGTARRTSGCGGTDIHDHTTRFEVTEDFVGVEAGDTVKIHHSLEGPSCGLEFERGQDYLIYSNEQTFTSCSPGGLAANLEAELEAIRAAD